MADITSSSHVCRRQFQEQEHRQSISLQTLDSVDDLRAFDWDPLSPPNASFFAPSSSPIRNSRFGSDSDLEYYSDSVTDPICFFGDDHMNLVTNLFEESTPDDDPDPFSDDIDDFRVFGDSFADDFGSDHADDLALGLGFGDEFDQVAFTSQSSEDKAIPVAESALDGLRAVGIESESDTEEVDAIVSSRGHYDGHWAVSGWDEVAERVDHDETERLGSVIERIEEITVSSEISSFEEGVDDIREEGMAARNLDWEVLLAVNNLNRNLESDNVVDVEGFEDDNMYTTEYDTLFGEFVERESAIKGSPPAAKSVLENLPVIVLRKDDLQGNVVVCAVCKDEILVEERVSQLPCCHHYHGHCIVPWLSIRNTCPVCRFELPTDDPDYERRKSGRGDLDLLDDFHVRYDFDLLP
ncbi:hypothetical protein RJ639_010550 [Escallonia herrerae]|uniref:RING-type E3 ubiquitin transferase n=1 Tax=Escallonia herrerae TaxID=1293975 RepID=A0AA88VP19_9ASTE|nr:hypothetical protein RJ639_010550 [Escallonia herrerae]